MERKVKRPEQKEALQPKYLTVLLLELNLCDFRLEKTAYHTNNIYIYIYIHVVYIVISMSVYPLLILVL